MNNKKVKLTKEQRVKQKEERRAAKLRFKEEFAATRKELLPELAVLKEDYNKIFKEYVRLRKIKRENPNEENILNLSEITEKMMEARRNLSIIKARVSVNRKVEFWSTNGSPMRKEVYQKRSSYALIAPYFFLFLLFTIIPVFMSIIIGFTNYNILETPRFVGFDNYRALLLTDTVFLTAIRNTLILALITGPLSYIMAFVFAWLINELRPKMRAFMTLVFYAPSISGNVYLIWKIIFSSDAYGYANAFLMSFNLISEPILWLQNPRYIIWIIILVQLWLSLGVSFLAFIAGLQSTDKTLYEAGAVDGIKNRWQELWFITLPQMKSQLMFGAVMQITSSLAIAEVATQISGFPSVQYAGHTLVTHLMDYGSIRYELGYASAIATLLFIMMILANLLVRKIIRRVGT